jgi:hypothetical protein
MTPRRPLGTGRPGASDSQLPTGGAGTRCAPTRGGSVRYVALRCGSSPERLPRLPWAVPNPASSYRRGGAVARSANPSAVCRPVILAYLSGLPNRGLRGLG